MDSNSRDDIHRRRFLLTGLQAAGGAWASLHWPAVMAAADHAARMRDSLPAAKLEILTVEQAAEIEAAASRIIPTDATPGASEAGVIYFIDRALGTFDAAKRAEYERGLPILQAKTQELFPHAHKFSQATIDEQDAVLKMLEGQPIFELLVAHTVMGFLSDPMRGGNRDSIGWKLIGLNDSPAFAPPFGFYDRDYPGWQPQDSKK